jgi:ribosomal protein S12 methylthiotransferase accessory factor YcaO
VVELSELERLAGAAARATGDATTTRLGAIGPIASSLIELAQSRDADRAAESERQAVDGLVEWASAAGDDVTRAAAKRALAAVVRARVATRWLAEARHRELLWWPDGTPSSELEEFELLMKLGSLELARLEPRERSALRDDARTTAILASVNYLLPGAASVK